MIALISLALISSDLQAYVLPRPPRQALIVPRPPHRGVAFMGHDPKNRSTALIVPRPPRSMA